MQFWMFDPTSTGRHGTARHGTARHGTARHRTAGHGTTWHGVHTRARTRARARPHARTDGWHVCRIGWDLVVLALLIYSAIVGAKDSPE